MIAEIGINHDGKRDRALRLIDEAAAAGADAVKFQQFRAAHMYVRPAGKYRASDGKLYDIYRLMERTALPLSWIPGLIRRAHRRGVRFICTACDEDGARWLAEAGSDAIKIASSELTHHPLLQAAAATGLPVIISTGAALMEEIGEAISVLRSAGAREIGVMHCVAAYPAPVSACNLRVLPVLRRLYPDVMIGFSDHTLSPTEAPVTAAEMGAQLIEKHFTLNKRTPGADHAFSLEPAELARMVDALRSTARAASARALGTPEKRITSGERYLRRFARRWIFTVRRVRSGERLSGANVRVLRPGQLWRGRRSEGLHPRYFPALIDGARFARDLASWTALSWRDLDVRSLRT